MLRSFLAERGNFAAALFNHKGHAIGALDLRLVQNVGCLLLLLREDHFCGSWSLTMLFALRHRVDLPDGQRCLVFIKIISR